MNKGTWGNPFKIAPIDWHENGVPYGAFCECKICELVERSTMMFDYFADKPSDYLICETCKMGTLHDSVAPVIRVCENEGVYE